MKKRQFGKTGVDISEVGLGTWQLGGADWGVLTEKEALAILHRAVDSGISFFDTADVYGWGVSERFIGKFLREAKGRVFVATKLGRKEWVENKGWPARFTLDMVRKDCQESIRNLGVDALFLQQWHCVPTEWYRSGEVLEHLDAVKREGLIRNWGCSVETVEEGLVCARHPGCASLQVIYNIFRQKLTDELLPAARKQNVGILARVPLASGLLSGRFKAGHQFDPKDHRSYNADGKAFNVGETFAGVPFDKGAAVAAKIEAIVKPGEQATMAQLALRWILDHDAVTAVIPGATKPAQIADSAHASSLPPLSADTHRRLRELYEAEIAPLIRGAY